MILGLASSGAAYGHLGSLSAPESGRRRPAGPPLTGTRAEAPWDPGLADALREAGVRVEEEAVLDELLTGLG
ncbi:DUF2399 domain-containing protein [Streptomyces sp. AC1-42T]|uniref:DUF2399 domain-containing protein n=1 Tax=unclassified Streptomyces TaxID=2593676 RepID=UPI001F547AB2|nr:MULTISPECIES: DUF2399 domain-containing protein [unclassified Streptomyces]